MIADNSLDNYNRLIAYFLYNNYVHFLKDDGIKKTAAVKLKSALDTLRNYLKQRIDESGI